MYRAVFDAAPDGIRDVLCDDVRGVKLTDTGGSLYPSQLSLPGVGGADVMYAVIQTGGKQYRVKPGDTLKVETVAAEAGQVVEFDKVLLIGTDAGIQVGRPFLSGGKVTATVTGHGRHPKIRIIKFRRRKHHMKRMGHRQNYTEVRIDGISA